MNEFDVCTACHRRPIPDEEIYHVVDGIYRRDGTFKKTPGSYDFWICPDCLLKLTGIFAKK